MDSVSTKISHDPNCFSRIFGPLKFTTKIHCFCTFSFAIASAIWPGGEGRGGELEEGEGEGEQQQQRQVEEEGEEDKNNTDNNDHNNDYNNLQRFQNGGGKVMVILISKFTLCVVYYFILLSRTIGPLAS